MIEKTVEIERIEFKRPHLYDKQLRAFFNDKRYSFCEASTKAGKTHAAIVWLFEQAATNGKPGRNYWWVAPVHNQARIAFERMARAIPKRLRIINKTEQRIKLPNGAEIWFKSGEKPDNLYGEDVYAAIIDEASRLREDSWHAVRSTLTATKGPIRCIGNVKGRKNWFYVLSRRAQSGSPNMHYEKITAFDAVAGGVLDQQEIDDAKAVLPEAVFKELYLAEPSDDEGNPFGIKHIERCYNPLATKRTAQFFGGDLAKSFDWSVLTGLDEHGVQAYQDRWQGPLGAAVTRIDAAVQGKPCAIDATGLGVRPAEELQERGGHYMPITFSQKVKQTLLEGLAVAIQNGTITITDPITKDEMDSYEYEYTRTGVKYTAPEGMHDDCVIALALANYAKNNAPAREDFYVA